MLRTYQTVATALALALLAAGPAAADGADDDLAAVKKAVASAEPARPQAEDPAPRRPEAKPRPGPRGPEPQWFRVRVVEKAGKRGRVAVNLPLALVRLLGEDWRPHDCHACETGRGPTLGEILRALDSGQSLVEIEDEEATVRVWVD